MLIHKRGVTREVILIGNLAFKLPSLRSWKMFLHGLLANMQEKEWSGFNEKLCPVVFYLPGGFLTVMKRTSPLKENITDEEFEDFKNLPVEHKRCSFGILNGKIVAVDYGS